MYYHGFSQENATADKYWTLYDDELITLLFTKIVNKTSTNDARGEDISEEMVNNLFDLCFFINNDYHSC